MERLGFVESPTTLRIFANRKNPPHLWYTIKDGEVEALPTTALCGYLKDARLEEKERRGKPVLKLEIHLMGDRPYIVESGNDSQFAKGFLSAIASLERHQLDKPITLMVAPGEDEAVLFCRVFWNGESIKTTYDAATDWARVMLKVQGFFEGAGGEDMEPTPEPAQDTVAGNLAKTQFKDALTRVDSLEKCRQLRNWVANKPLTMPDKQRMYDEIGRIEFQLREGAIV